MLKLSSINLLKGYPPCITNIPSSVEVNRIILGYLQVQKNLHLSPTYKATEGKTQMIRDI